jgi:DNA-binding NtrC family response regulator
VLDAAPRERSAAGADASAADRHELSRSCTKLRGVKTVATTHSHATASGTSESQLVVVEGPDMGRAMRIGDAEKTVGTASDCDLVLTDERVSSRHFAIRRAGGGCRVRDLGSTNGTLYEGSRVSDADVPPGATLKVGHTFVRVEPVARPLDVVASQSRRFGELVAESLAMREVFAVLELAARSDVTVLLEGETGVGKELAARAIHAESERRRGPFVAIDCSALPENLVESELFGHVKGAFTGATSARKGAFARAAGGTLFLDELATVPLAVQARLLRAIEERRVRPVGADEEIAVDVRIVGGSREGLAARSAEGVFRPDLFYRLSVLHVTIPPLRKRREDIAPIASEILRVRGFEDAAVAGPSLDRLFAHDWPGNVRELRNALDRAIALRPDARSFSELAIALGSSERASELAIRTDLPFADAKKAVLDVFEKVYLRDLLARAEGNVSEAARIAGVDRKHFRTLAKRHGLVE